jgi:transketolase
MTAENRAAIRGLPAKIGDRFVDVGIAEQTMIGMAAGLALRGRIPVCHALATFLTLRAFEFIRTDVGIPGLPVKLVGGVPGFLSDGNGPTHQALEDVSLMRGIPGMHVFCPADVDELCAGLPAILHSGSPTYVRYHAGPAAVQHGPFEIGKAEVLSAGRDVALLTHGFLLQQVMEARELLEKRGISARVVNVRMPVPLDEAAVLSAAEETRLLVTVEDHFLTGGLCSIVAELLVREGVRCRTLPIALRTFFQPGRLPEVLEHERFTGPAIAARTLEVLERL